MFPSFHICSNLYAKRCLLFACSELAGMASAWGLQYMSRKTVMRLINMQGSTLSEGNCKNKTGTFFFFISSTRSSKSQALCSPMDLMALWDWNFITRSLKRHPASCQNNKVKNFDGALGLELHHTVLEMTPSILSEHHSDKLWLLSVLGTLSCSPWNNIQHHACVYIYIYIYCNIWRRKINIYLEEIFTSFILVSRIWDLWVYTGVFSAGQDCHSAKKLLFCFTTHQQNKNEHLVCLLLIHQHTHCLAAKSSVVQKILNRQKCYEVSNLCDTNLGAGCSNPIFSHDDDVPQNYVRLLKDQQFSGYSRNIFLLYKPSLWLWPWRQQTNLFERTLALDDTSPHQVWLQKVQQFSRYGRNIFWLCEPSLSVSFQ